MIKFTTALLATTFFAGTAFAQTTPIPKGEDHGHSHETKAPKKDVPFALTEAPDDHVLGSETAPITMIVWASVTCPHCSDWFTNEWPSIKKELIEPGKIRFVFRELPTQPAQLAMVGFMMAQCAPEEDYFSVIEYQMENQKMIFEAAEKGEARAEYDKIGKLAGLENEADINACLADQDKLAHIHTNSDRANGAAIKGVPAFYINGESYEGEQDAKTLINLIKTMDEKGLSALPTSLPKR
jgi:protein-disulfide isomerase